MPRPLAPPARWLQGAAHAGVRILPIEAFAKGYEVLEPRKQGIKETCDKYASTGMLSCHEFWG